MAKAKRKRKPIAATGKRRRVVDLLEIAPSRTAKTPHETPEQLLERKKAWEQIERALQIWSQRLCDSLEIGPVLELPDDWRGPTHRRPEPKNRLQPQQELCRRVFRKLFPDGRIPDEVHRVAETGYCDRAGA
jgi:hypothetical protein